MIISKQCYFFHYFFQFEISTSNSSQNGVCFGNLTLVFTSVSLSSGGTTAAPLFFISLAVVRSVVADEAGRNSAQVATQAGTFHKVHDLCLLACDVLTY